MKGPKGPSVSAEITEKKKDKKLNIVAKLMLYLTFVALVAAGHFIAGVKYAHHLNRQKPAPEPVVVEKAVEVVKFVERSKTETKDFLLHLNPDLDPDLGIIIAKAIDESSAKYRLPRKLICSLIRKESNINPFAKSKVGAVGLMQVMPKIHAEKHANRNLWHIATNIDVGCFILREYLDLEKGNLYKTFWRYLSKNATKEQIQRYSNGIYEYWAKLEMFDYLSIAERAANQNGNSEKEEVIEPQKTPTIEKEIEK